MDQEWEKIKKVFFTPPQTSSSESFVFRVMEKIESSQPFDLGAFIRWFIPVTGLMIAALFFVAVVPMNAEETAAIETVLSQGGSPLSVQETVQVDLDRDWMGLDAL